MNFGFIGTGNITTALVEGFCIIEAASNHILVSPRNAAKASRFTDQFLQVKVAADSQKHASALNAELVTGCLAPGL